MPLLDATQPAPRRRGVVLLAVLLIVVVLSLAAYQYGEWMTSEFQAADAYTRTAQAHALAESGVHYVAALIATRFAANASARRPARRERLRRRLRRRHVHQRPAQRQPVGQPADVPEHRGAKATATAARSGVFSIIGLVPVDDPTQASTPYRFGVVDEAGKINVNALLRWTTARASSPTTF